MLKQPELDPAVDVSLSQQAPWAGDVVHVINDNYLGIRAAVAALPGHKLVLPNMHWQFREHLAPALALVQRAKATKVIVHGMSTATYELARAVHQQLPAVVIYGVWHGGPSQWVSHHEASEFARFLEFDADGIFARSHIMKPGCNGVLRSPAPVGLVNCAPVDTTWASPGAIPGRVLVPAPPSLHKNLYGNLIAAELCGQVRETLHYAQLAHDPLKLGKARHITYKDPLEHQRTMVGCEVVLNASTMDCHPMVDLEAACTGRPSVHMKLGIPVLDEHPLGLIATVEDSGSIASIGEALERVLSLPSEERTKLSLDYAATATTAGKAAMEEFLYG